MRQKDKPPAPLPPRENLFLHPIHYPDQAGFLKNIFDYMADSVFVKDDVGRWIFLNRECCQSMGYPREFLLGKTDFDLFDPAEASVFSQMDKEVLLTGKTLVNSEDYTSGTGEKVFITTKKSKYIDAEGNAYIVGVSRDITSQRKMEKKLKKTLEQMEEISLTDDLTRLYNRRGFISLAEVQMRLSDRHGVPLNLVFADLNNMKHINDQYGHLEGDCALKACAQILKQSFRKSDILGRLGGDEFVVLAISAAAENAQTLNMHILENLKKYNLSNNKPYSLSMAIGIVPYRPGADLSIYDLLQKADQAMYQEKVKLKPGSVPP